MAKRVAILMGSPSDKDKMQPAADMLERLGIGHEVHVMSAHRHPDEVASFVAAAPGEDIAVFICGAGMAAHLAGAVAARTTLPVIGVPLTGGLGDGLDALLATVQMPPGMPVATVAVDGAANAALLAASILAVEDATITEAIDEERARRAARR